jgi:catechol-2,3-dioxygenase
MAEGTRLRAAIVFVRNLDKSVAFYRELLDLEMVDRSTTAALLESADGSQLALRAFGDTAERSLASIGVQYLAWTTSSRAEFDRMTETLRRLSAYQETRTDEDVVVIEGRDPDDLPVVIVWAGDGRSAMRKLPARIYAW